MAWDPCQGKRGRCVPAHHHRVRFREDQVKPFEALLVKGILPTWEEFKASDRFLTAAPTPVEDGCEMKEGVPDYVLTGEVPCMAEHAAPDEHPRFLALLENMKPMQPEEPFVWFGDKSQRYEANASQGGRRGAGPLRWTAAGVIHSLCR